VIFGTIGIPSEDDKSFVTDQKALEYLESFPWNGRTDLEYKYPGAPKEAIDFLNRVLVFNPYFRISLKEAIEHPLFDSVRRPQAENFKGKPIELEFEKTNLNKKTLRELFLKEIYHYKTA